MQKNKWWENEEGEGWSEERERERERGVDCIRENSTKRINCIFFFFIFTVPIQHTQVWRHKTMVLGVM